MYKKSKVKDIVELILDGKSNSYITRVLEKTSINTVIDIRSKLNALNVPIDVIKEASNEELYLIFYPEKFKHDDEYIQPDFEYIHQELGKVGVTLQLLWEEYVDRCVKAKEKSCSYPTFTRLYNEYFDKKSYTSRIPHKPGEKVEVDWSGPVMYLTNYQTGKRFKVYLFVATLPYSQLSYVEATYTMKQEDWLNCHVHLFEFLGGTPLQIVCDNLKTGVNEHPKFGEIVLNDDYRSLAEHYNISVSPTRVRKPKDKPSAEGTVGKIATAVIASLRNDVFYTLDDLNEAIRRQMEIFNNKPFQKKEGSRMSIFNLEERQSLQPLPSLPFETCKWIYERKVNFNSHIIYKYNWYSVPTKYINNYVDLKIGKKNIEIFFKKELIATHTLINEFVRGDYRTLDEHFPNHKVFKPWTVDETLEYAKKIGPNCLEIFNRLVNEQKVREQAILSIVPIIEKSKAYSNEVFEEACKNALDISILPHYKVIKSCLDKLVKPKKKEKVITPFLRGGDYYAKDE